MLVAFRELLRVSEQLGKIITPADSDTMLGDADRLGSWVLTQDSLCREQIDFADYPCSVLVPHYKALAQSSRELELLVIYAGDAHANRSGTELSERLGACKIVHENLSRQIEFMRDYLVLLDEKSLSHVLGQIEESNKEAMRQVASTAAMHRPKVRS